MFTRMFVVVLTLLVLGCGGDSPQQSAETDEIPGDSSGAVGTSQRLQLDYSEKTPIDGYQRFEGSCGTFPYNLQVPADWEMQASRGTTLSKTRVDDTQFAISIGDNHGSVHAHNLESAWRAQGAVEVGRIAVGGQEVSVLGKGQGYTLHAPHGDGALFHAISVRSTLGVEQTLKILETLEPPEEC